ncbi:MAG: hypothetical protein JWQ49_2781 [Edaphobacter sp.]|nr:hypothetical protein [Edaphobacter sp.]
MCAKWVEQASGPAAVVFVHGVLSSGDDCWANVNGAYWPNLVASSAPELSVYVTTYRTGLDSRTFSVNNASDSLFEELELDGVMQRRLIVFVCHSMGGLVVRRMLVAKRRHFVGKQIGLFLVASPSLGSIYANWLTPIARFFKHSQADTLRMGESNQWLTALDQDFFGLLDELDISGRELVEDRSILRLGMISLEQIVSPLSGERYFRDPLKIGGSDHFSIAKPADTDALQHRVLMEFLRLRVAAIPRNLIPGNGSPNPPLPHLPEASLSPQRAVALQTNPTSVTMCAQALLRRESLVDYVLAADEEALAALVASVPPGRGIGMAFVADKFKRAYFEAVTSDSVGNRVAAASALVRACSPQFEGRWHLVSIADGEIVQEGVSAAKMVYSAFHLAGLRGPRMLAAMIVEAPLPALLGARGDAEAMLRKLLIGGAS